MNSSLRLQSTSHKETARNLTRMATTDSDRGSGQASPPATRTRSKKEGRHTNGVRSGMEDERSTESNGIDSTVNRNRYWTGVAKLHTKMYFTKEPADWEGLNW